MTSFQSFSLVDLRADCTACAHEFAAPVLPDLSYGTCLVRNAYGRKIAAFNYLDIPFFKELDALVAKLVGPMSDRDLGRRINIALDSFADPIEGERYSILQTTHCPKCGSDQVDLRDYVPARFHVYTLPIMTFDSWASLSPEARLVRIKQALQDADYLPN